jgi:hypothetical protein
MKRDEVINILCKLKYSCDDFANVQTSFLYDFDEREYEIKFEREDGRVVKFHLTDIGETKKAQDKPEEVLEVVNEAS